MCSKLKDLLKHGELRITYTTSLGLRKRQIFALLMAVSCHFDDNLQATKKYTLHYLCSSLDGQLSTLPSLIFDESRQNVDCLCDANLRSDCHCFLPTTLTILKAG